MNKKKFNKYTNNLHTAKLGKLMILLNSADLIFNYEKKLKFNFIIG